METLSAGQLSLWLVLLPSPLGKPISGRKEWVWTHPLGTGKELDPHPNPAAPPQGQQQVLHNHFYTNTQALVDLLHFPDANVPWDKWFSYAPV